MRHVAYLHLAFDTVGKQGDTTSSFPSIIVAFEGPHLSNWQYRLELFFYSFRTGTQYRM